MKLFGIVLLAAFLAICTSVPLERDIKTTLDSVNRDSQVDLNTPHVRLVRQYFPYFGGGGFGGGAGLGTGFAGASSSSFSSASSQSGAIGSGYGGGIGDGLGNGIYG